MTPEQRAADDARRDARAAEDLARREEMWKGGR